MKYLTLLILAALIWYLRDRYKGYPPIEYEEPWGV